MGEWVSVMDRLPKNPGYYLVYTEEDGVFSAEYNPNRKRCPWTDDYEGYCDLDVTHWMPLPKSPKEMHMKTLEQVAADYGLTPDGVSFALKQYQKVICEITHSRMSKLSYYADDILRIANEVKCNGCEYTEPRLLTLEEIQHTDAVWLETHGWKIQGGDIHETVLRRMSDFEDYVTEFADNDDGDITCVNSTIGIDWRCWNIKPSDEQRKNAPWKE